METISYVTRKARKEHLCDYCHQPINKGEDYNRAFLKADYVWTWKSHVNCQCIATELDMFDDFSEGVGFYEFSEFINEAYKKIWTDPSRKNDEPEKVTTFAERLEVVCQFHLDK